MAETIDVNSAAASRGSAKNAHDVASLNHPNFGWGVNAEDMMTEELKYFEIFNGHPGVRNYGDATHVSTERMWDIVLARTARQTSICRSSTAWRSMMRTAITPTVSAKPTRAAAGSWCDPTFSPPKASFRGIETGDYYCSSGHALERCQTQRQRTGARHPRGAWVKYKTQFIATCASAQLTSELRKDKDGKPLDVTRNYHAGVGKVVAESDSGWSRAIV